MQNIFYSRPAQLGSDSQMIWLDTQRKQVTKTWCLKKIIPKNIIPLNIYLSCQSISKRGEKTWKQQNSQQIWLCPKCLLEIYVNMSIQQVNKLSKFECISTHNDRSSFLFAGQIIHTKMKNPISILLVGWGRWIWWCGKQDTVMCPQMWTNLLFKWT